MKRTQELSMVWASSVAMLRQFQRRGLPPSGSGQAMQAPAIALGAVLAAQRMKARMRLLLERGATQAAGRGLGGGDSSGQWTRFVFNKDALLDEEGARPEGGAAGAANSVSLRGPRASPGGPAPGSDAAHEAAIFGTAPHGHAELQSSPARIAGLLLFRSGTSRAAATTLGVGFGAGSAYADCQKELHNILGVRKEPEEVVNVEER
ncbi:hypothetical protein WJX81_003238 [Elliptochloris bilobata]|uniref:Uncharacterized protein n=1 Tax=Elliptochloris bilobata TaxID=381761 RepID=A0AAW1R2J4_9CHLO